MPGHKHAGYGTITNTSDKTIVIRGLTSQMYNEVSLHDVQREGDIVAMVELDDYQLLPGKQLILSPGGKHLMLMGPTAERTLGQEIPITLTSDQGEEYMFNLLVKPW